MMHARNLPWSKTEKAIARRAFESAYRRECQSVAQRIRDMSCEMTTPEDLWGLHDFLRDKRAEIDAKYDYRYSVLLFVLARLLKEGWLHTAELEGLQAEKVAMIDGLVNL